MEGLRTERAAAGRTAWRRMAWPSWLTLAAGLLGDGTVPAAAQQAEGALEDVVVTAERHESGIQKTPIAITAFSGETLQQEGVVTARDLAGQIPNLSIPRSGITPFTQLYFLRGIGESDPIQNPSIATYVDDVYIPRGMGSLFDLVDLERVEVLRGPQGTLYGRNAAAGALRLITKDPTDTTHLSLSAGIGDYGDYESHDYVSGALVPGRLTGSFAISTRHRDGYTWDPVINQHVNDINTQAARGKLLLQANDHLTFDLAADGTLDFSNTVYYTPQNQPGGAFDPYRSYVDQDPSDRFRNGGVSLRAVETWNDHLSLKSITSYRAFAQSPVTYDNSGSYPSGQFNTIDYFSKDATQEFQVLGNYDRLSFSSGLFLYHEHFTSERNYRLDSNYPTIPALYSASGQNGDLLTDSEAVYTHASYKLTPALALIAGVRLTHEEQDFKYYYQPETSNGVPSSSLPGRFSIHSRHDWNSVTPKLGVEYQWTPDLLQYASYTQGSKAGGFDNRATKIAAAGIPFAPETVNSWETGIKSDWFEHRARANIAIFYNNYTQLQQSVFENGNSIRLNAGEAHTEGFELETAIKPVQGLTWSNNLAYLYTKFDTFANPSATVASANGNSLIFSPRWNGSSKLDYALPIPIPGVWRVGGDVTFQTKEYSDVLNTGAARVPWQSFLNAFTSYTTEDGHWTADLAVRNLLDRAYKQTATASGSFLYYSYAPPRMVLFTLRYQL